MENYQQSTGAKGTLQCYGEPIKNARIKLYDADTFGFDYTMDEAISDWNGNFQVEGSHVEYTTLEPKIKIYHKCGLNNESCQRRSVIRIPEKFITRGNKTKSLLDINVMEMSQKIFDESLDCN